LIVSAPSAAIKIMLTTLAIVGLAVACRSTASETSGPSLVGTSWRALEIDGHCVLDRVESTLSFVSAERIAGQAACNRYFGDVEMGEGRMKLQPTGTTRMACPPEGYHLLLLDDSGRVQVGLAPGGSRRTRSAPPSGEGDGHRRRTIMEDARARGVEFRATGNEPGWVLELFGDRIVFAGDYGARRLTTPRPPRQVGSATGEEVYVAATPTERMTVRIRPRPCVDTMSGQQHGTAVEVELDDKAYRGCGDVLR
jgi:uncharacterized membrane protein